MCTKQFVTIAALCMFLFDCGSCQWAKHSFYSWDVVGNPKYMTKDTVRQMITDCLNYVTSLTRIMFRFKDTNRHFKKLTFVFGEPFVDIEDALKFGKEFVSKEDFQLEFLRKMASWLGVDPPQSRDLKFPIATETMLMQRSQNYFVKKQHVVFRYILDNCTVIFEGDNK